MKPKIIVSSQCLTRKDLRRRKRCRKKSRARKRTQTIVKSAPKWNQAWVLTMGQSLSMKWTMLCPISVAVSMAGGIKRCEKYTIFAVNWTVSTSWTCGMSVRTGVSLGSRPSLRLAQPKNATFTKELAPPKSSAILSKGGSITSKTISEKRILSLLMDTRSTIISRKTVRWNKHCCSKNSPTSPP